jgi:hypothetical protein
MFWSDLKLRVAREGGITFTEINKLKIKDFLILVLNLKKQLTEEYK